MAKTDKTKKKRSTARADTSASSPPPARAPSKARKAPQPAATPAETPAPASSSAKTTRTRPFVTVADALPERAETEGGVVVATVREFDPSPPTRRSSPVPPPGGAPEPRIPALPRVRVEIGPPRDVRPRASSDLVTDARKAPEAEPTPRFAAEDEVRSEPLRVPPTELVGGYDLDGETAYDIAPIAATEHMTRADDGGSSNRTTPPPPPAPPATVEELEQQIRELESRLDRMIRRKDHGATASVPRAPRSGDAADVRGDSATGGAELDEDGGGIWGSARELLSTDYYLRQWGKMGMRNRSEEVDEFGLDPKYEARFQPLLDFLYRHYFRVDVEGTSHIPDEGRCLIVSNHSGGPLPYDGLMLRTTVRQDHPRQREVRWLAEDFIYYLPFVGAMMNRIGAVRACPENAERLLSSERAVAVFPEGAKGVGKLYRDRYRLQRFGRGGFIRLCLRMQAPLIPCAVVGAEEANPMLYRVESLTKVLGIPYLPITPTFPALGPLGLLPAPTKWKVRFGDPITYDEYGPEAADDDVLVGRLAERVRGTIQGMVDRILAERQSIWFG